LEEGREARAGWGKSWEIFHGQALRIQGKSRKFVEKPASNEMDKYITNIIFGALRYMI